MALPAHIQTEDKSFVRETNSKGLLCTDTSALLRHRREMERANARALINQRLETLEEKINNLTDIVRVLCAQLAQ